MTTRKETKYSSLFAQMVTGLLAGYIPSIPNIGRPARMHIPGLKDIAADTIIPGGKPRGPYNVQLCAAKRRRRARPTIRYRRGKPPSYRQPDGTWS